MSKALETVSYSEAAAMLGFKVTTIKNYTCALIFEFAKSGGSVRGEGRITLRSVREFQKARLKPQRHVAERARKRNLALRYFASRKHASTI